ncbi:calponin homology domain-containing protein DDB_G0272472-like isoform X3 [Euwallacea similis]|uniref:calponin homology domain-containing protein DDB_G0272472-like isoform X3 n=1 Tax=Euwallacea similis TaxID=1736056 RepID=UPI00344C5269
MEYDKHIKRLVLGYLKNECKNSYKIFLRTHFHNQHKHVATRVAGQTLEDILQTYSRIHDIVQGHLEDTNYYKDRRNEISPIYLVDQLLYLLEYDRPLTPTSTIRDRSSVAPSLANTHHEEEEEEHRSDVETTPEHSLPGNLHSSDENHHFRTPFSNPSPVFRTPYLEKLPTSEHHTISTVMSKELLKNKNFPKKLAQSINMVLNTPERSTCRNDTSKSHGLDKTVIKDVLHRTEADPMFEDLLNDFFGPIGSTIEKALVPEVAMSSSSSTTTESPSPFKQIPAMNEHDTEPPYSASTENPNNLVMHSNQNGCISTQQKSSSESSSALQALTETPNQHETITSVPFTAASSTQTDLVQQQFYIVNQPVVIPQPMQIMPVPVSNSMIKDINQKVKNGVGTLTEQEIMAMPTIFLNEQNEITYAETQCDSNKQKEVQNLKEYINVFGLGDHSPVIKQPRKKSVKNVQIRPTPSIKVEIFQRNSPLKVPIPLPDLSNSSYNDNNIKSNSPNSKKEKRSNSPSTDSSNKSFADENRPNILNAICTPSPIVSAVKKPTPKSSSHVRSLTFPSPIRRTNEKSDENRNSPSGVNKQQATKDLFNDKNENEKRQENNEREKIKRSLPRQVKSSKKAVVKKCSPLKDGKKLSWDADLRMLAASSPCGNVQDTPSRKTSLKSVKKRPVECRTLETEAKTLKGVLKTPRKTPSRSKKVKSNKQQSDNQKTEIPTKNEEPTEKLTMESKKVLLSPSKLCNNASKRNMDVDSITPNNPKEGSNQLISNARKNINALLDTPLKEIEPLNEKPSVETSTTPFTPMLKANLQGLAMTDNFTIETPDFPVTPGLSIMETSITNYCILNDTETNKVTEAIVLSEEKKSSVRKTDDEEVEVSPKVYSCKVVLEEFNRSQVGKKNLELLDSKGVHWEGSSEKEEKSESTCSSESNGDCNNTVIGITSVDVRSSLVKRGGKSMKMLKSQLLDSENDTTVCFEESFTEAEKKEPLLKIAPDIVNSNATIKTRTSSISKLNKIEKPSVGTDSEIVSNTTYKERIYNNMGALCKAIEEACGEVKRRQSSSETAKADGKEDQKFQEGLRLKNVLSIALEKCSSFLDNSILKNELEEKRKLVLKLEKAMSEKSASRRKSMTPQSTSKARSSKQKGTAPKKLVKNSKEVLTDEKKRDSQDEFFQKSGTNLHRTNRQRTTSEESKSLNEFEEQSGETVIKNQIQKEEEKSFWDELQMELQSEEITVVYNYENISNKVSKDYLNVDLKGKAFRLEVPLTDGSTQPVDISVTPYRTLWEILPKSDSKEDNCSDSDCVRTDDQRCLRKRKHRSDSSNSNSSTKKKKPLLGTYLNNKNIEVVLSMLHGPSDKT